MVRAAAVGHLCREARDGALHLRAAKATAYEYE
jgi:hypothetical protein